jgi:hypothetical protein
MLAWLFYKNIFLKPKFSEKKGIILYFYLSLQGLKQIGWILMAASGSSVVIYCFDWDIWRNSNLTPYT